ncbi:hypothetical protein PAXINDRAFT_13173 [Paxillus involutus ATCC 200175]|uniref:Uncharacterized protein n=1 Tax=Paxillus involutus ATCC 200175 TaxID=664439 RepID=A0A0C9U3H4_PAXIN|nr:hypothetical protein PAXINDRAFT_13173 [Paxillus involutus ATCC 200175]
MILRVAVMFNHPKRTTYILSFLYLLVTIEAFIIDFLWIGPHSGLTISSVTLVDDTLCEVQLGRSMMLPICGGIPGGLFDLLILALSVYRFVVHSIETKKMLGRTKVNVYMRLLFEHSVLYFVLNLADKGLADGMNFSSSTLYVALANLYCSTVPYVLFPRLVLSFKGHRSESSGLYVDSDPPQHSHAKSHAHAPSHSHSHSVGSGDPSNEEYELIDGMYMFSPALRAPAYGLELAQHPPKPRATSERTCVHWDAGTIGGQTIFNAVPSPTFQSEQQMLHDIEPSIDSPSKHARISDEMPELDDL